MPLLRVPLLAAILLLVMTLAPVCPLDPIVNTYSVGGVDFRFRVAEQERTGRTTVEYTFAVEASSSDIAAPGSLTAVVTSSSVDTLVTEDTVVLGGVSEGEYAGGSFTVEQDRSQPFNPSSLEFRLDLSPSPGFGALLPGPSSLPAAELLLDYATRKEVPEPSEDDVSRTVLYVAFEDGATLEDVNEAIASVGGRVISILPGDASCIIGVPPQGSFEAILGVAATLEATVAISSADVSPLAEALELPVDLAAAFMDGTQPPFEIINHAPVGGPATWNARKFLESLTYPTMIFSDFFGPPSAELLVEFSHLELEPGDFADSYQTRPLIDSPEAEAFAARDPCLASRPDNFPDRPEVVKACMHGWNVMGVALASWQSRENAPGDAVTGLIPDAPVRTRAVDKHGSGSGFLEWHVLRRIVWGEAERFPGRPIVINRSVTNVTRKTCPDPCFSNAEAITARELKKLLAGPADRPLEIPPLLLVQAAGNTPNSAAEDVVPLAAVASDPSLAPDFPIIVVENHRPDSLSFGGLPPWIRGCRADTSSIAPEAGNVAGIGRVNTWLSPTLDQLVVRNGSSGAAPQVAAAAALVWAVTDFELFDGWEVRRELREAAEFSKDAARGLEVEVDFDFCDGSPPLLDVFGALVRVGGERFRLALLDIDGVAGVTDADLQEIRRALFDFPCERFEVDFLECPETDRFSFAFSDPPPLYGRFDFNGDGITSPFFGTDFDLTKPVDIDGDGEWDLVEYYRPDVSPPDFGGGVSGSGFVDERLMTDGDIACAIAYGDPVTASAIAARPEAVARSKRPDLGDVSFALHCLGEQMASYTGEETIRVTFDTATSDFVLATSGIQCQQSPLQGWSPVANTAVSRSWGVEAEPISVSYTPSTPAATGEEDVLYIEINDSPPPDWAFVRPGLVSGLVDFIEFEFLDLSTFERDFGLVQVGGGNLASGSTGPLYLGTTLVRKTPSPTGSRELEINGTYYGISPFDSRSAVIDLTVSCRDSYRFVTN